MKILLMYQKSRSYMTDVAVAPEKYEKWYQGADRYFSKIRNIHKVVID